MNPDYNVAPVNPLPWAVWVLVLPIVAVELVLAAGESGFVGGPGAIGWRLNAIRDYGFFDQVFNWMLATGRYPPAELMRFVTYPFIHGGATHVVFVAVFVLALGKFVGEVFPGWAVLAVFFGSAAGGAAVYGAVLDDPVALIGGYPAAYGLIGAFTYILWTRLGQVNANRARAFTLIGFLLAFQLVFGLLFGGGVQWVAEVAGFVTGFLLSFVVSPGGWAAVLRRLRQA